MFKLCGQAPVPCNGGPAVFQNLTCGLADIYHWFDGEKHSWPDSRPGAGPAATRPVLLTAAGALVLWLLADWWGVAAGGVAVIGVGALAGRHRLPPVGCAGANVMEPLRRQVQRLTVMLLEALPLELVAHHLWHAGVDARGARHDVVAGLAASTVLA